MIEILDCKSSNYLPKLKSILDRRRSGNNVNTDIAIKIVKETPNPKVNKIRAKKGLRVIVLGALILFAKGMSSLEFIGLI